MLRDLKRVFLVAVAMVISVAAFAQKVTFEASAPTVVMTGEVIRLEFTVNAKGDNFTPPKITGLEVMAGPTESRGQSVSIVNGNMTQSVNVSYTYVLVSDKPGKFTIPPAKVEVDGSVYSTKPLTIEVIADNSSGKSTNSGSASSNSTAPQSNSKISADDIFVKIDVNKHKVYKGEPVKATFKLYTRVPLSGVEAVHYPAFNGFWSQNIGEGSQPGGRENINSKIYETHILRECLLFPQQSGDLKIDKFDLTVIAQIVSQDRRQSIFDDFFSGASVQQVRKHLVAKAVNIDVMELPAGAPDSYNGAVGEFTMTADGSSTRIAANSSSTFTIKISGDGNLPLIQAPKIELPASFEQYNVKTTESLNSNGGGIVGYRQFEYPIIARSEGQYQIKPVEFTFFNPNKAKYETLSTGGLSLEVLPDSTSSGAVSTGLVSGISKEDVKLLGEDIRFIKIGKPSLVCNNSLFFGSLPYFISILLIIGLFIALLIYLQKRIKDNNNTVLVKGKRANKVALQRLKMAKDYMERENQRGFYEELLRALWGYMSDKLNIPVANLTKDNVREELLRKGISADHVSDFITIITDCEYAQYSPGGSGHMHEIYKNSINSISKFETTIKR